MAHRFIKHDDSMTVKVLKITGMVILGAAGAAGFALLFGYIVMQLWNWLMPDIFGLAEINFWKAVGIIILARLVFGGFKHGSSHHSGECRTGSKTEWEKRIKDSKPHFEKWKYYDSYWEEEGKEAFNNYVERQKGENN